MIKTGPRDSNRSGRNSACNYAGRLIVLISVTVALLQYIFPQLTSVSAEPGVAANLARFDYWRGAFSLVVLLKCHHQLRNVESQPKITSHKAFLYEVGS